METSELGSQAESQLGSPTPSAGRGPAATTSIFGDALPRRVRQTAFLQEADQGPLNNKFSRTFSAGDIHRMKSRQVRFRAFNASGPQEDLLHPIKTGAVSPELSGKLSPSSGRDPSGRQMVRHYTDRAKSSSPVTGDRTCMSHSQHNAASERTRALDYAPLGESLRIKNHVQPDKARQISLCGDVFKGFYKYDWTDVSHIHALRSRYPMARQSLERVQGPYPQGMTREELIRNRLFDRSHGSERFPGGMLRVGSQMMFP